MPISYDKQRARILDLELKELDGIKALKELQAKLAAGRVYWRDLHERIVRK